MTRGVQVVLENRTCADSPCMQFANRFEQMDNYIYICICVCAINIYIYIYIYLFIYCVCIYIV